MAHGPIVWILTALAAASALYYLGVILACLKFRRRSITARAREQAVPPVSILKPVRGLDPHLEDNLRAHLEQSYPTFEILIGVADPDDPAIPVAEALGLRVIVCGEPANGNRKVAILERLVSEARHDLLLIDDADIRPPQGWLAQTVAALEQPNAGLATCLYHARPGATLGSKLDALWVSADFTGQALTGAELAGVPFALGATMLLSREDLERIGGFAALRPYLADDFQLGARIATLGRGVALSSATVETVSGDTSLGEAWRRHLRWSRTVRVSRPGGHFGLLLTFGTVWGFALLAVGGAPLLAGACLASRCAAAATVARTVGATLGSSWLLLPAADLWAFAVWIASFFGATVTWRGRNLRLDREGRILPGK